eukprot:Clim_evm3s250 gene=Clim_evmTU3s250
MNYDPDWVVVAGIEEGITRICRRSYSADKLNFNYPIDLTFKAANAFGWPQVVISAYGPDILGRDVVLGSASQKGPSVVDVPLFVPQASSKLQQLTSYLTGHRPERFYSTFSAMNRGRDVTKVRSQGRARLRISVVAKDAKRFGYVGVD